MSGNKPTFLNILIKDILPSPYQPRKYYNSLLLDELSRSIKMYGVLQPILVRRINKKYEIISGERRIRAAEIAGLKKIPAYILDFSDTEARICSIIENIHRENLTYLDESECMSRIADSENLNLPSLGYVLCKDEKLVEEKLRFRRFSPIISKKIAYYKIPEEHAKQILRLSDDETREKVIFKIADDGYDIKQTKELVEKLLLGETPQIETKKKYSKGDLRLFKNTLNQTVTIMKKSGMKTTAREFDSENFYEYVIRVEKAK